LIAAPYFGGNIESSPCFVRSTGLLPDMIRKSSFNRRLHKIEELLSGLFFHARHAIKGLNINSTYFAGSFPAGVCQNIRISRSRIVKGEEYRGRGYYAFKRAYFYGCRVYMTLASDGIPAEFSFIAGKTADIDGFRQLPPNLPDGSEILADARYLIEGMLADKAIKMFVARKINSKQKHQPRIEYLINKG
jgi:hypothetical protein